MFYGKILGSIPPYGPWAFCNYQCLSVGVSSSCMGFFYASIFLNESLVPCRKIGFCVRRK